MLEQISFVIPRLRLDACYNVRVYNNAHIPTEYVSKTFESGWKSMKTRKRYEGGKRQWKRWEKETKTGIKGEKEGRSSKGEDRACRREDGRARKRTVLHAFAFSVAAAFVPVVFRCLFSAFITLFNIYDPVVADLNENERHEARKTWFPSPFFSMRDTANERCVQTQEHVNLQVV